MKQSAKKKADQLGIPQGTASGRLRKSIIFNLLCKLGENYCYQCQGLIETEKELSIEHKVPYLDSENPIGLFFDLDNIAFSHLTCNVAAARCTRTVKHPSRGAYLDGCRCEECKRENSEYKKGLKKKDLVV